MKLKNSLLIAACASMLLQANGETTTQAPAPVLPPPLPATVRPAWLPLSRAMIRDHSRRQIRRVWGQVWSSVTADEGQMFVYFEYTPGPLGVDEGEIAAQLAQTTFGFSVPDPNQRIKLMLVYESQEGRSLFRAEQNTYLQWDQQQGWHLPDELQFTMTLDPDTVFNLPGAYQVVVTANGQYSNELGWQDDEIVTLSPDKNGDFHYPTRLSTRSGTFLIKYRDGGSQSFSLWSGNESPLFAVKGKFPTATIEGLVRWATDADTVLFTPEQFLDYTILLPRTKPGAVNLYAQDKESSAWAVSVLMNGAEHVDTYTVRVGQWTTVQLPAGENVINFHMPNPAYQQEQDSKSWRQKPHPVDNGGEEGGGTAGGGVGATEG